LKIVVRKAKIRDVRSIQQILATFAGQGKLLARSLSELYTNIRELFVYVDQEQDEVVGCCGLHIVWENLAEIRSLAVMNSHKGLGVGRRLVEACIFEAEELGIETLFALTYEAGFFDRLGFRVVDKNVFPQKIWADCINCPKFPDCDEIAMTYEVRSQSPMR
jgi:amino-acid N-acetyltransferase